MNKYSIKKLKKIIRIIDLININENEKYDFLKIMPIVEDGVDVPYNNALFFAVYSTPYDIEDDWVDPFDYRLRINELIERFPDFSFVVEKNMIDKIENKNAKLVVVDDILKCVDKIFKHVIHTNKQVKTVAITGSVGKTTIVGLIQEILKSKYNVLRIYSKRITPLILKSYIINLLNKKTDFITLEMSHYHRDHVKILSDLLHPYIAGIINADSSHINIDRVNTIEDICIYKSAIFKYATIGYYNSSNEILSNYEFKNGILYFKDKIIKTKNLEEFNDINDLEIDIKKNKLKIDENIINPFLLSRLSVQQIKMAYLIGKKLDVDEESIIKALNNYKPVENRLQKYTAFGKEIIFDGDISTNERIKQLSYHLYNKAVLVIRKLGSSENNKRFEQIIEHFDRFEKVYLFDDIEYLEKLKKHPKVCIVHNNDFLKEEKRVIFYHYSGYFRSFSTFDENNLNIYENEKYKILKLEENEMNKKNILLIHGWNYRNYTSMTTKKDCWDNRTKFVKALEKKYNVYKLNLPGFCGRKEPKENCWDLFDFAKYVNYYIKNNNLQIDYVLGYSFGGPVAITLKNSFKKRYKLILVCPAIIRNQNKSRKFKPTPKIFNGLRRMIRDFYLVHIIKTPEMRYGTKFLRASYQTIVRKELIDEVEKIKPEELCIIYGDNDKLVNPSLFMEKVKPKYKKSIHIIKGGGHNLATANTKELVSIINEFTDKE